MTSTGVMGSTGIAIPPTFLRGLWQIKVSTASTFNLTPFCHRRGAWALATLAGPGRQLEKAPAMFRRLRVPWPQMLLLLLTVVGLVKLHVSLLAVALIALVWMFTLWLDWIRPDRSADPFVIAPRPDLDGVARAA